MAMLELKDLLKTKVNLKLTKVKKAVYMTAFFFVRSFRLRSMSVQFCSLSGAEMSITEII